MSDRQSEPSQQPPSMPAYPSAPPVRDTQSSVTEAPPTEITLAFWGWLVSAVIVIVGGLLILGQKQQLIDAVNKADTSAQLNTVSAQAQAQTAMILTIVLAVIVGLLYALFAFKLRAGRNWARIVLTVIAALSLINLLTRADTANVLSYIGELAAVIAAVLSYLPKSNAYIQKSKRARAAQVLGR